MLMTNNLIHDRGRGPEIQGTRITIQDLITYLMEPSYTEEQIAKIHNLTGEQVAAARSYILSDPETLIRHMELESRPEKVSPPEVIERASRTRKSLQDFKNWLANRRAEEAREESDSAGRPGHVPSFREWLAEQESRSGAAAE
jgi:uncharacterized protein (DUF433 family)